MCDHQRLRPACAYRQSDHGLCLLLEYSMNMKLLTENHLEFLSFNGGCTGTTKSTFIKMQHCWKSHVLAHRSLTLCILGLIFFYIIHHTLHNHKVYLEAPRDKTTVYSRYLEFQGTEQNMSSYQ